MAQSQVDMRETEPVTILVNKRVTCSVFSVHRPIPICRTLLKVILQTLLPAYRLLASLIFVLLNR